MRMGQLNMAVIGRLPAVVLAFLTTAGLMLASLALGAAPAAADDDQSQWVNSIFSSDKVARAGRSVSITGSEPKAARSASRKSSRGTQVASLGSFDPPAKRQREAVTGGGGVRWVASSGCLNGTLRSVINSIASSYGSVTVSSTCRSAGHNRRVGGAPRSMHLSGDAADFRVHGNWGAAYASLRGNGSVGGLKHYGGGLFHIDTGARRSW